jgi:hypothetical protein
MAYARFIRHPSSCQGAWQASVFQRLQFILLPCAVLAKNASFESCHSVLTGMTRDAFRDLRYAMRNLRRNPAFATLAILIMALGISGTTAVFSLVNQVLLHPVGISEPKRILVVRTKYNKLNLDLELGSVRVFADARASTQFFEYAAAARPISFNFADRAVPVRLPAAAVSAGWFDVFGARPALGRFLLLTRINQMRTGWWYWRMMAGCGCLAAIQVSWDETWSSTSSPTKLSA